MIFILNSQFWSRLGEPMLNFQNGFPRDSNIQNQQVIDIQCLLIINFHDLFLNRQTIKRSKYTQSNQITFFNFSFRRSWFVYISAQFSGSMNLRCIYLNDNNLTGTLRIKEQVVSFVLKFRLIKRVCLKRCIFVR